MIYADVIIDISHEKLDRDFQYRVPEELEQSIKPALWLQCLSEREIQSGRVM